MDAGDRPDDVDAHPLWPLAGVRIYCPPTRPGLHELVEHHEDGRP